VKVKRLFLWYADRHGHAWFKHLDQSSIDLGKGKRQLVSQGHFDSRYQITLQWNCSALEVATMASDIFEAQVALPVRVLPHMATETCFALKGGTAINLFVRDLPRLSVNIAAHPTV
jgi:hypothetical protein